MTYMTCSFVENSEKCVFFRLRQSLTSKQFTYKFTKLQVISYTVYLLQRYTD